jgi:hypothetical protein
MARPKKPAADFYLEIRHRVCVSSLHCTAIEDATNRLRRPRSRLGDRLMESLPHVLLVHGFASSFAHGWQQPWKTCWPMPAASFVFFEVVLLPMYMKPACAKTTASAAIW